MWKSANQAFKTATFIPREEEQRHGLGGDMRRQGEVVAAVEWAWAVPHSPVMDKNWEGYLGSE